MDISAVIARDDEGYDQDLEELDISGAVVTYDDIESYSVTTTLLAKTSGLDYNGVIAQLRKHMDM